MTDLPDPFAALGLPARADLTGDDVRAAWRRIAAATHPDRADGGDPARFAAAAAAYSALRTATGRGEALADLAGTARPGRGPGWARRPGRAHWPGRAGRPGARRWLRPGSRAGRDRRAPAARMAALAAAAAWRLRHGRPGRLGLRAAVAAAVSAGAIAAAGAQPAVPAVITGALTWLVLTGRHDLAPPP